MHQGILLQPNNQAPALRPIFLAPPTVNGLLSFGNPLTITLPSITNSPTTISYQWFANGSPIAGQNSGNYSSVLLDVGKLITVEVTASNAFGSTKATTAAVTIL